MIMQKKNLFELDVLRVIGMALILYSHSTAYLGWSPRVNWLLPHPGAVGLSIFFFLSGFLLKRSLMGREHQFDILTFLKSRSIRIIPLYWIAILAFILVFHFWQLFHPYNFEPLVGTVLTHAFALQLAIHPRVPEIPTLWYVGALIPYYLLFAISARLNLIRFLAVNLLTLGVLYGLKFALQSADIALIDMRLLIHFPTFLIGVCCARFDYNLEFLKKNKLAIFISSTVLAVVYLQLVGYSGTLLNKLDLTPVNITYYGYCLLWAISFISLAYVISPLAKRIPSVIAFLSVTSYPIYLFHRPLYGIFYSIVTATLSPSVVTRTILFPVATLVLIGISYYFIQFDSQFVKPRLAKVLVRGK